MNIMKPVYVYVCVCVYVHDQYRYLNRLFLRFTAVTMSTLQMQFIYILSGRENIASYA
jgi:hypothetical protein